MKVFSVEDVLEAIKSTAAYIMKSNISDNEEDICLATLYMLMATIEDLPVYNAVDNKESV